MRRRICPACRRGQVLATVYRYYAGRRQAAGQAWADCRRCGGTGKR